MINITTYDPASVATNAVTLRAANGGLYKAEGTLAYKADRFGVRLSARGGVENAFDVISRDEFQSLEEVNAEIAYDRTIDALGGGFSLKGFYNRTSNILFAPDLRFQRDANCELTRTPVGGTVLGQDSQIASL